jgi:hypothetical protein
MVGAEVLRVGRETGANHDNSKKRGPLPTYFLCGLDADNLSMGSFDSFDL